MSYQVMILLMFPTGKPGNLFNTQNGNLLCLQRVTWQQKSPMLWIMLEIQGEFRTTGMLRKLFWSGYR